MPVDFSTLCYRSAGSDGDRWRPVAPMLAGLAARGPWLCIADAGLTSAAHWRVRPTHRGCVRIFVTGTAGAALAEAPAMRVARVNEQPLLKALAIRASPANPGDRATTLANPEAIEVRASQIEAGQAYIASLAGTIIGLAALPGRQEGGAGFPVVLVDLPVLRQGAGRWLIEQCVVVRRAARSARLHLIGNPRADPCQLSCGFTETGVATTRSGPATFYQRRL